MYSSCCGALKHLPMTQYPLVHKSLPAADLHSEIKLKTAWLNQICVLAETQKMAVTSRQLGISPHALKKNLLDCEQVLQTPLLAQQHPNYSLLTPAGALLASSAQEIVSQIQQIEALFQTPVAQSIWYIGYSSELARAWLTQSVLTLQAALGSSRLCLLKGSPHVLHKALASEQLQLLVSAQKPAATDWQHREGPCFDWVVVAAQDLGNSLPWQDRVSIQCTDLPAPFVPGSGQFVLKTDSWSYALMLCQQSHWALCVPEVIARPWLDSGTLRIIAHLPEFQGPLVLSWKTSSSANLDGDLQQILDLLT